MPEHRVQHITPYPYAGLDVMPILRTLTNTIRTAVGEDPIRHVIVLMFENHSFDQMLGCFKSVYPQLDGVDPQRPGRNDDLAGRPVQQQVANDPVVSPDPKHELDNVERQLEGNNGGFAAEYQRSHPDQTVDPQRIMDYFGLDELAALHALAHHFTICDKWFSSVPGPTWTNRFFIHSGTSLGRVRMPGGLLSNPSLWFGYDQATIFDRLNERGISWKVYFGDIPHSLVLTHQRWRPKNASRYRLIHSFYDDAQGPESAFPAYTFIEPCYLKGEQDDDHPSHSSLRAQRLLARVYNAIRRNTELWSRSLLVVVYDEHGGFYDHVIPPSAVPPDEHHDEYSFDRFGIRVPAILVSPWVDRGVLSTQFDHTSVLKYLIQKWKLRPLTKRVQVANTIGEAIRIIPRPLNDTPEAIRLPPLPMRAAATEMPPGVPPEMTANELAEPRNDLQEALIAFARYLEQSELSAERRHLAMMAPGPLVEEQQAKRSIESFLDRDAGGNR